MNMSYTIYGNFYSYIGDFMISGIYRIYSIATSESYYGSSKNIHRRFIEHKYKLRKNKLNHKMLDLLQKHGIDNFKFEILEHCLPETFEQKEKEYIAKDPQTLNVWINPFSSKGCALGDKVKGKKFYGTPHTQATKDKQSKIMKEHWSKNDPYWKGKAIPQEQRKKVSEGLKTYYSTRPGVNLGRKMSEETKKKISETLKNKNKLEKE